MILGETQNAVRATVRAWARDRVAPKSRGWEEAGSYPRTIFAELADLGLMGMVAPAAYGGAEADYVSYALALMELAGADGGLSTIVSVHNAPVLAALLRHGNEEQKERFAAKLCTSESIGAFALTESKAGSDAAALRTKAVPDGGGWRIDGSKQFITSARASLCSSP